MPKRSKKAAGKTLFPPEMQRIFERASLWAGGGPLVVAKVKAAIEAGDMTEDAFWHALVLGRMLQSDDSKQFVEPGINLLVGQMERDRDRKDAAKTLRDDVLSCYRALSATERRTLKQNKLEEKIAEAIDSKPEALTVRQILYANKITAKRRKAGLV